MKKHKLLMILLMMSFGAFSQSSPPLLKTIDNKPRYCFNQKQAKDLAKRLTLGQYDHSLVQKFTTENIRLRSLLKNKKQIMQYHKDQLENYALIVQNNTVATNLMQQKIKVRDRKIKRNKTKKFLMGVGLIVTTTLLIIK